jgi:hypothetical protein
VNDDYHEPVDTLVEADDDTERRLGAFPNPSLDECPVVPLGFDGGKVIFAMPEGEIRTEPAAKIGQLLKVDIFACAAGQAFLTTWRDSDDKFQRDLATVWFVRRCREAGKWDSRRVQRGLGVWPGEPGEAVLHRGAEIQRWRARGEVEVESIAQAMRRRNGPMYLLRPPAPRPDPKKPASAADGAWLRRHMDAWRFEPLGAEGLTGADVLAGYVGLALLGAVAPFRAHVLLAALPGSGKTTFLAFISAVLSGLGGEVINSFTDAGFRAEITGMARPVVVDEAESATGDLGPGPVEQVLNYLRLMATGAGANRKQVDTTGAGLGAQTAVGAVLMAAVLPPRLDSALATRVAEVKLLPIEATGEPPEGLLRLDDAQLAEAAATARDLAPRLLARALRGASRYREDMTALKAAVMAGGREARTADLVAALGAGRRLLMSDEPLTAEEAEAEAAFWRPLLESRDRIDTVSNPGADALAHLLNWDSGLQRNGHRVPLGDLVKWQASPDPTHSPEPGILANHGLRIYAEAGPGGHAGPWLLVANHHPALARIFGRTQWKDHRKALEYLGALDPDWPTWCAKPLHFGVGVKSRSLAIPLTPWLEKPFRAVPGQRSGEPDEF